MSDINKVWLSGIVVSDPILTKLSSKTPFCTFSLEVKEKFLDRNGQPQFKASIIQVESLGKSAETTATKVKKGVRFIVDGYLRQDIVNGHEHVKVRTFAVYPDESNETLIYKEGIKQALDVIKKSRDKESAIANLEDLVK